MFEEVWSENGGISMSFKIKIVDNTTGNVLVDRDDAKAIVGAVGTDKTVECMAFMHCDSLVTYHTISGVQSVLANLLESHPELNILAQIEDFMEKKKETGKAGDC